MIRVNLSRLTHVKPGPQETVDLNVGRLAVRDLELSYVRGTLRFTRISHGILVEGRLRAAVKAECTRCLTSFSVPITIELEDTISLPGAELTEERPVRVADDGWADLFPLVREYAWVELPVNPICSPDCKGICPECGGNRNLGECTCDQDGPIDPRWQALRALVEHPDEA